MVLRFRRKREIAASAALLVTLVFVFTSALGRPTASSWRLRSASVVGGHPYVKPSPPPFHPPFPTLTTAFWNATRTAAPASPPPDAAAATPPTPQPPQPDRALVVAALEGDDVAWLAASFPGWHIALYNISAGFALLHHGGAVVDKGRIANAYLTYLIENYYSLPETMVFLTPHINAPAASAKLSLGRYPLLRTLNINHVQAHGYANLRCTTPDMCRNTILPFRSPPDEYRTLEVAMPKAWARLFPDMPVPEKLAAPCCAEFAVSRAQVRKRALEAYTRFWDWLNTTKMDDETAGLVLEALWHVIFGRGAVDCTGAGVAKGNEVQRCECDVYGKC